jgi:NhaP-type Na+/H+ or K+/H+ antiporter
MYEIVAVMALFVFLYSLVSKILERTVVGGAITFVVAGLILGNFGAGLLDLELNAKAIGVLAELTLAFLLFADASTADLKELTRQQILPRRMLLIGLPGAVILGFVVGIPFFGDVLPFIEIAVLAAILAPTDAALGKAVVTDKSVPNRLRTTLNFESGLNDGLCVPIFLTFMAFASATAGDRGFGEIIVHLLLEELGIGALVAIAISGGAVVLLKLLGTRDTVQEGWSKLMVPAIALACFSSAQALGGSGFIAAFVGGLIFGGFMKAQAHKYVESAEVLGDGAALLTWLVFGATVVGSMMAKATWQMVVYALLSLTIVRMLPIWLSLRGTGTNIYEALFLGWFGPRGLASIVFAIMVIEADIPGADVIAVAVSCAVTLSIIAHGVSAKPFAALLARTRKHGATEGNEETQ